MDTGQTMLYRHFDASGVLLYVGISLSAPARLCHHRYNAVWFDTITTITIQRFETREDALDAEAKAIKTEHPLYNKVTPNRKKLPHRCAGCDAVIDHPKGVWCTPCKSRRAKERWARANKRRKEQYDIEKARMQERIQNFLEKTRPALTFKQALELTV